MNIGTKHLVIGALVLVTLGQGENVRKGMEKEEIRKSIRTEFQDKIRAAKDEAKEADELSKVALERADKCIKVFHSKTLTEAELTPETPVVSTTTKEKLRPGAIICSGQDTAVVNAQGNASQIARVSASDLQEFNRRKKGNKQ